MTMPSDSRLIAHQYERFPYPSPADQGKNYPELANLFKLFELDCGYELKDKRILDAGTGTGLRLLELARSCPQNEYLGVDQSARAISVAEEVKRASDPAANVTFHALDIDQINADDHGTFDVIVCMGVLHHLEHPAETLKQLGQFLRQDGVLFFYVYGEYGSSLRMSRKRILRYLCGDGPVEEKIAMAKNLNFTNFPYGWELRNSRDINAMLVDAYVNEYEKLYTLERIDRMVSAAGYEAWVPYGFVLEKNGILVETRTSSRQRIPINRTTPGSWLKSTALQEIYHGIPKRRQLSLLEEWYQPAAYTVLIHNEGLLEHVNSPERLVENTWR